MRSCTASCQIRSALLVGYRCVFELASFVSKSREASRGETSKGKANSTREDRVYESLIVLPLWRPVCLFAIQMGLVIGHASEYISSLAVTSAGDSCVADGSSGEVPLRIVSFVQAFVLRMSIGMLVPFWIDLAQMAAKDLMLAQLRSFRFENVKCRDPEDREQVSQAIAELYACGEDEHGGGSAASRRGIERFEHDVQSGSVYKVVERTIGTQAGVLDRKHAMLAFLPNLFRAFSYFPPNFESQPNLFLFHAVVMLLIMPPSRELVLRFYRAHLQAWLPRSSSCTLGCMVVSVLFSVLALAVSFPFMLALRLVQWSDIFSLA